MRQVRDALRAAETRLKGQADHDKAAAIELAVKTARAELEVAHIQQMQAAEYSHSLELQREIKRLEDKAVTDGDRNARSPMSAS